MSTRSSNDDPELPEVELTTPADATEDELRDVEDLLLHLAEQIPLEPGEPFTVVIPSRREIDILRALLDQLEKGSSL